MDESRKTPDSLFLAQIETEPTEADIRSAKLKGIGLDSIALLLGGNKRFLQVYLWPFIAFGFAAVEDRLKEYALLQEDFSRHIRDSPLHDFSYMGVHVYTEVVPKGTGVPVDFGSLDAGVLEEWVKISEFPAIMLFQSLIRLASRKCQLPGVITSHVVHAPTQKNSYAAWEQARSVRRQVANLAGTITENERMLTMLDVTEMLGNEISSFSERHKSHPYDLRLAADNIHYDWSPDGDEVWAIITDIGSQIFPDAAQRIEEISRSPLMLANHCQDLFGIDF